MSRVMKVITNLSLLKKERRPIVLAAGFFDGLHRGHKRVIAKTITAAERIGGAAWVLTFDEHPIKVLRPSSAPLLLTSNRHKLRLLRTLGVDGCLLLPFTRRFASLEPEAFVELLAGATSMLRRVLVGDGWRFGRKERGDAVMLKKLAGRFHIKVTPVEPVLRHGRAVSSTRIREEVARGNLKEAGLMLGRPFSILGTVVGGRAIGRKIGFPTANLETFNEVLPPFGVYAVRTEIGGRFSDGVVNIGVRPTFKGSGGKKATIEAHLLGLNRNLYGREVEVFFIKKLRDEKKFASADDLRKQIEKDVKNARKALEE